MQFHSSGYYVPKTDKAKGIREIDILGGCMSSVLPKSFEKTNLREWEEGNVNITLVKTNMQFLFGNLALQKFDKSSRSHQRDQFMYMCVKSHSHGTYVLANKDIQSACVKWT